MKNIKDIISNNLENITILKQLANSHRYLGELKGLAKTMPNESIIVNSLSLQEAQDSSEIENIITTQDEIYKQQIYSFENNIAAKEVNNYANAINYLYQMERKNNIITINHIVKAQKIIKNNNAGIRKQIGTNLKNTKTGQIIYTPPHPDEINDLLKDLEYFINDDNYLNSSGLDPLIKMAIIHHQFESIHPFYDGNGRIGRIINIIYLINKKLLDTPILYLSRYINHNKEKYYSLLQKVRDENAWNEWILYILKAIEVTAKSTLELVINIKNLQQNYKEKIRNDLGKIYSQDLINNIFKHPYTKAKFLEQDINLSRATATRYLDQLTEVKILQKEKLGKENYYFNVALINILKNNKNLKD